MLGTAAGKTARVEQPGLKAWLADAGITRKIWLPRLVYDALPWFYLLAAIASVAATVYIYRWIWAAPQSVLFSAACLQLAWFVFRRRRHLAESEPTET